MEEEVDGVTLGVLLGVRDGDVEKEEVWVGLPLAVGVGEMGVRTSPEQM